MKTLLLVAAALPLLAQEAYRIDVTIRNTAPGAKPQTYTILGQRDDWSKVNIGGRVPVPSKDGFTYIDIGTNIQARMRDRNGTMFLDVNISLSDAPNTQSNPPTVRQLQTNTSTTITPGKPTLIAALVDPGTQQKYEIEATVNPVK